MLWPLLLLLTQRIYSSLFCPLKNRKFFVQLSTKSDNAISHFARTTNALSRIEVDVVYCVWRLFCFVTVKAYKNHFENLKKLFDIIRQKPSERWNNDWVQCATRERANVEVALVNVRHLHWLICKSLSSCTWMSV
jgi:hypothetical protein